MSGFEVKITGMKQAAEQEQRMVSEIAGIENDIRNVLNTLHLDSGSIEHIRKGLNVNLQNVGSMKQRLGALSAALEEIAAIYADTENRILGQGGSAGEKSLSNIRQKIDAVSEKYGLDCSSAYSKDPVNLCNGNYVYEKTFFEMEAESELKLRIFYNMQNPKGGVLGRGWMHTWEVFLEKSGDRYTMVRDDASKFVFTKRNGTFYPEQATLGTMEETEQEYIVTDREQQRWHFDKNGVLMKKEMFGNTYVELKYGADGDLEKVYDENDFSLSFLYSGKGILKQICDHTGRTLEVGYKNGRVSELKDSLGRTIEYRYNAEGYLTELINAGGTSSLKNEYDEKGRTVCQTFPDGGTVRYDYQDEKRQVVMTEQNGNKIIYEHDVLLRNTKNIYADGEETFTYNANNQRTSFTDKRGNVSCYGYDERGNLIRFLSPLQDELQIEYTDHNQVKKVLVNGKVLQRAAYDNRLRQIWTEDALGNRESYEYDDQDRPVVWTRPDKSRIRMRYSNKGELASITNTMGGKTSYEYDDRNQVTAVTDALGNRTEYQYDDADKLILVRNALGKERKFEYDPCGNLVRVTDFNGGVTEITYNSINKPISVTDADGNRTCMDYDTMWKLVKQTDAEGGVTEYEYDALHRLVKVTDPNGGINRLSYDACGNLTERIDPEGAVHRIDYDALNRPNYIQDPEGMEVRASYDALGNITQVAYGDGTEERYEYDDAGNMTCSVAQDGYEKHYQYDVLGNLCRVTDDEGTLEAYEYYPGGLLKKETASDGRVREFRYDRNENIVEMRENSTGKWSFSYDELGRVVKAEQKEGICETYEYDALDNVTAVTDGCGARTSYHYTPGGLLDKVTDALGHETFYAYDRCNRLIRILQSEEGKPDANVINRLNEAQKALRCTSYLRDPAGNVTKITDPAGNETDYTYDLCGRILSRTDPDGTRTACTYNQDGTVKEYQFTGGEFIRYQYDRRKHLTEVSDWNGKTAIQPDTMGRTLRITDPEENTISFEWGKRGERTAVVYPDGKRADCVYDEHLRLLKQITALGEVTYSYYPNGKLRERAFPGGRKTAYEYNPAGYLSKLSVRDSSDIFDCLAYEYDHAGRKSRITRTGEHSEEIDYRYSARGELTELWKNGALSEQYEYDARGNRLSANFAGEAYRYTYNELNQLLRVQTSRDVYEMAYDGRGNLTDELRNGKPFLQRAFDARNRVTSVQMPEAVIRYKNDSFGNRIAREETRGNACFSEKYVYDCSRDQGHLLSVRTGAAERNILWDGDLLGEFCGADGTFFVNDERMTPIDELCGAERHTYPLQPGFGGLADGGSLWGYTGYRKNPEGTLYANAREYDPFTGRFLSKDAWAGLLAVPLTLNAYCYCMNDPVNRVDPTGMIVAWLAGGIVGAVANVAVKVAGDVVNSVATGKVSVSSWQSYLGTATSGFATGTTFVATGGNMVAAEAAGSAVGTFVEEGTSMLTGAEGYRKEDGYSWQNLLGNTAKSAIKGAAAGKSVNTLFGQAAKYVKIPKITSGIGSAMSVWKQVMTKAKNGVIHNLTFKTLGKGLLSFGAVKTLDQIIQQGKKKAIDMLKKFGAGLITGLFGATTVYAAEIRPSDYLTGNTGSAACPAEGN